MTKRELIAALETVDDYTEVKLRVMGRMDEPSIRGVVFGPCESGGTLRVALVESSAHVFAVREGYFEGVVVLG